MLETKLRQRFLDARRRAIEGEFQKLNPEQREAVLQTEGPLLLLAGAGSGKTTVLIHRISNLLRFGKGADSDWVPEWVTEEDVHFLEQYQKPPACSPEDMLRMERLCTVDPVRPWEILAITFTNKAAGEIKERLEQMVGLDALDVWASTFHSACVRILRREIEHLGFPSSFGIYDTDDSIRVIKACLKEENMEEKSFPPRVVLGHISRAKNDCLLAADYEEECRKSGNIRLMRIAAVYGRYQDKLWQAGALDFDDIILNTVRILQQFPDVREYYQRKFRYVLVDEYQDTNHIQYLLTKLLADGHKNICVVGDDDQSIYRFRGATIENILSFEAEYPEARVIRLEQNYRSTGHILEASNAVIQNNDGRKGKKLWTKHGMGKKIQVYHATNEQEEALHIASQILRGYAEGKAWKDFAVLYRMNAQSNQIEMALKRNSIPHRIIGGFRFFERAEIKDMLSYLSVIHNPGDDLRLLRIINTPSRGIGAKALEKAQAAAREEAVSLWDVVRKANQFSDIPKTAAVRLLLFADMIQELRSAAERLPLPELYDLVLEKSGYLSMLEEKQEENATRIENVKELKSSIVGYANNTEDPSLFGFLDEVALFTDLDNYEDQEDSVTLMTIHSAKGLEFPTVFVVGMEEGVFPGFQSAGEPDELEEERRLCYVAMTRAKENLHLSCAQRRMLFGKTSTNMPSRFIREVPEEYTEVNGRDFLSPNQTAWDDPWRVSPQDMPSRRAEEVSPGPQKESASHRKPTRQTSKSLPDFAKGDMVRHSAFGDGMLLSIQPMGGDALLEVAFDNVGTKRLMLKAAAQHMQKL